MKLMPGFAEEYKTRHDNLWPELKMLLKEAGISDYSIYLEEETNCLFAVLKCDNIDKQDELPQSPVMQLWWQYMGDIMETNADNSPVTILLKEVFHLP
jgi:L-rhamnose mutarotase